MDETFAFFVVDSGDTKLAKEDRSIGCDASSATKTRRQVSKQASQERVPIGHVQARHDQKGIPCHGRDEGQKNESMHT